MKEREQAHDVPFSRAISELKIHRKTDGTKSQQINSLGVEHLLAYIMLEMFISANLLGNTYHVSHYPYHELAFSDTGAVFLPASGCELN